MQENSSLEILRHVELPDWRDLTLRLAYFGWTVVFRLEIKFQASTIWDAKTTFTSAKSGRGPKEDRRTKMNSIPLVTSGCLIFC